MDGWKLVGLHYPTFLQPMRVKFELTEPNRIAALAHGENFQKELPGKQDLGTEDRVLTSVFLEPGSWRVIASAKLVGVTAGPVWTNVRMTLLAEGSDLYPQQPGFQSAEGNSIRVPITVTLHVQSSGILFVSLLAGTWGYPGRLEEVKLSCVRDDQ